MKFNRITFKCWYNTYYNQFEFWSPNCSAVKNHCYDKIYKTATDIRHDVIADLKKEYFLSDDDIKLIDQKIFAALAKTTSEKLKRDYNKYLKKLLRSVKCNKEFTGAKE